MKYRCTSCLEPYDCLRGNFYVNSAHSNGYAAQCKLCSKEKAQEKHHLVIERIGKNAKIINEHKKSVLLKENSITTKTANKYLFAISEITRKYYWSEKGVFDWMNSKERASSETIKHK